MTFLEGTYLVATCQACAVCLRITRVRATLAALFGGVDVAFPPLLKQVFAGITPCARLIRTDRCRTLSRTLIRCGA